jgi:hypothetical protein
MARRSFHERGQQGYRPQATIVVPANFLAAPAQADGNAVE